MAAVVDQLRSETKANAGEDHGLAARYRVVRGLTERLAAPLSAEDQTVQSMSDTSPTKWHRAHTTWFFETFLLKPHLAGYRPLDPAYAYLFNSYYEQAGERHPRPHRSEEHTSELQSLMRISYAVFCLTQKKNEPQETLRYATIQ